MIFLFQQLKLEIWNYVHHNKTTTMSSRPTHLRKNARD